MVASFRRVARNDSDEAYVIGLCSKLLGEPAKTQHRFEWLLGNPSTGRRATLPVDGNGPGHQLLVEYRELQHHQPVAHFDKPDKLTVSYPLRRSGLPGLVRLDGDHPVGFGVF